MLFFDPLQFEKLVQTGGAPNRKVTCSIHADDGDFVLGGDFVKLDFHPLEKDLCMPVLILAGRFDRILIPGFPDSVQDLCPLSTIRYVRKERILSIPRRAGKICGTGDGFLQK